MTTPQPDGTGGTAKPGCFKGCLLGVAAVVAVAVLWTVFATINANREERRATSEDGSMAINTLIDETTGSTYSIRPPVLAVVDHGEGRLEVTVVYSADASNKTPILEAVVSYPDGLQARCKMDRSFFRSGGATETLDLYCTGLIRKSTVTRDTTTLIAICAAVLGLVKL